MRKLGTIFFFIFILIVFLANIETVHAATGNVTIYYNDINQHPVGKKVSYATCTVGTNYTAKAPAISGYTYDANSSVDSTYCSEGENIIAFVYQTNGNSKEGSVKVACYDTNGNKLSKCTDGRSGTVGASYYINPPTLDGYKFVRVEGANNGTFKEGSITVKFYYESTGGNLVEKKEETPAAEKKEETKKEETKKNNNTVTKTKVVSKNKPVASNKKDETKEEVKEVETKVVNKERTTTIVDNTKDNTTKYIAMSGIFSSILLLGFVIKKSLVK